MKVLISACLLGENCKYNGGNNFNATLAEFLADKEVVTICPEVFGGLPTPRLPVEIADGKAINVNGEDCTPQFEKGALLALEIAKREQPDIIILQPRSPSCGVYKIYDGSFCGKLIDGMGFTARVLKENGFAIYESEEIIDNKGV